MLLFILLLCGLACAGRTLTPDSLALLWQNQLPEANAASAAVLRTQPQEARALLTQALLASGENAEGRALRVWRRYCQAAPASWQTQAYWPEIVRLARVTGRWDTLEAIASVILASPRTAIPLRASARLVLARGAISRNAFADAEAMWSRLGFVRQWMVIGPFDNMSPADINQRFPPGEKIDFSKSYPGLNQLPLAWCRLALVSGNGYCRIGTALNDHDAALYYAVSAVAVATAQSAILRVEPVGAATIYVNGTLVFRDELYRQERDYLADPYAIPITLRAGWNTVWVQIASDDETTAAFRLRLTTPAGALLPGAIWDAAQAKSAGIPATEATLPPPESTWTTALAHQPPTPETALALGYLYGALSDPQRATAILRTALVATPNVALLHWQLAQVLHDDAQEDDARAEYELARAATPRLAGAELSHLADARKSGNENDYLDSLRALRKAFPESPAVCRALSEAYADAEREEETITALETAVKLAGGAENLSRLIAGYRDSGRKTIAFTTLLKAIVNHPNDEVLLALYADELEARGNTRAVITTRQLLERIGVPDPTQRRKIAQLQAGMKNVRGADATLSALRAQCPLDAATCIQLGDLRANQGRKAESAALYERAVSLDPAHVELREKIQALRAEPSTLTLIPATPLEPLLEAAKQATALAGMPAKIFLDETRGVVYPDFATDLHRHMLIKIFTRAGVQQFSHLTADQDSATSSSSVEIARVIKADGKVQDLRGSDEEITVPGLAPGDIIEVAFRVRDYHPGALARQFWTQWHFSHTDVPVALSRFALLTPPRVTLYTRAHGDVPAASARDLPGWRLMEWRQTDVPAAKSEPLGLAGTDETGWLDISTIATWQEIIAWYHHLAGPMCVPDSAVRGKARQLTTTAKTDAEKIRALTNFVAREIHYQSTPFRMSQYIPTRGWQVLRDRYGDCKDKAALLTALLAAVDIKADIVLLSGRDNGITPYLPSPRFTHAITRVQTADGPLWIDSTAESLAFGHLPLDDQGVPALVIDERATDLTTTPQRPVEDELFTTQFRCTLDDAGKLNGAFALQMTGNNGAMLRAVLARVPETQYDAVLRRVIVQFVPKAALTSGTIEQVADPDQPLRLNMKFTVEQFAVPTNNPLLLHLPWIFDLGRVTQLSQDPTRTQDLELSAFFGQQTHRMEIALPPGYVLTAGQASSEGTSPWGQYHLTRRVDGNVLSADLTMTTTALRVPAIDLPRFRDYLQGLADATARPVALKR